LVGHLHKRSTRFKLVNAFQIRSTHKSAHRHCGHRRRTGPFISSNRNHSQSFAIIRNQSPSSHRPIHLIRPLICWQVGTAMHAFARDQPPIGIDIARRAASHLWGMVGGRRSEHLHAASTLRAAPRPTSHVPLGGNQSQSAVISRHQSTHLPRGIRWQAEALSGVRRSAVHHLRDLCVRSQHIPVGKGGRRGEHMHAVHHLRDLYVHIPAKLGTPSVSSTDRNQSPSHVNRPQSAAIQSQSAAISHHQSSSAAISRHQSPSTYRRIHSSNRNQSSSVIISHHQPPSIAINVPAHPLLPRATKFVCAPLKWARRAAQPGAALPSAVPSADSSAVPSAVPVDGSQAWVARGDAVAAGGGGGGVVPPEAGELGQLERAAHLWGKGEGGRRRDEHLHAGESTIRCNGQSRDEHLHAGESTIRCNGQSRDEHLHAGESTIRCNGQSRDEHLHAGESTSRCNGHSRDEHLHAGESTIRCNGTAHLLPRAQWGVPN